MKLLIYLLFPIYLLASYQAVCVVPVAEMTGQAFTEPTAYNAMAWDYVNPATACPRLDQLLFHEVVTVLQEENGQLCIRAPERIYQPATERGIFWLPKKALRAMRPEWRNKIPRYNQATGQFYNAVVTLQKPWRHATTGTTYSAGTHFVLCQQQPANNDTTAVWCYNQQTRQPTCITVPTDYIVYQKKRTALQQRQLLIAIARQWITEQGFIPYVSGGCSYTERMPELRWKNERSSLEEPYGGTVRILVDAAGNPLPYTVKIGCDCSGLIRQLARIAGIPLSAKNSVAMLQMLQHLPPTDTLQEGDIIYIKGHVMLVADRQQGTLIEARGRLHGYGYVQEIPLHEEFAGITSYAQLEEHYQNNIPVKRINRAGQPVGTYTVTLLKLCTTEQ